MFGAGQRVLFQGSPGPSSFDYSQSLEPSIINIILKTLDQQFSGRRATSTHLRLLAVCRCRERLHKTQFVWIAMLDVVKSGTDELSIVILQSELNGCKYSILPVH
jgi:hypothetical protein